VAKAMPQVHCLTCILAWWRAYGTHILSFLLQYDTLFPTQQHTIQVYCDNKGLIDHICNCSEPQHPQDIIHDDYPIYAKIDHCIQQLKPLALHFIHILGHQDTKSDKPLTLPECLNINCDTKATNFPLYDIPTKLQSNPRTTVSYPHLCIWGQIIFHCLQTTLRDTAT